jgi:hypothetical protein
MGGSWWSGGKAAAAPARAPGAPALGRFGSPVFKTDDTTVAKKPIQTIGEKTFYWKNDCWRDADVTAENEKNLTRIKPFSDAYFALAARDKGRFAKYLTLDGPVLIVLDGKTYLITKDEG